MKDTKSFIGGLIAGAALGITAGLLLAPHSGQKTRKNLLDGSLKLKDDLMTKVDSSMDAIRKKFNSKIDQLENEGKAALENAGKSAKV